MKKIPRIRVLDSFSDNRKSKTCPEPCRRIQNLKWLGVVAIGAAFAMCGAVVEAQQPTKVSRIGFLIAGSPSDIPERTEAFRQGLRERGYVEGKNIVFEYRYAEGKLDRLPALG